MTYAVLNEDNIVIQLAESSYSIDSNWIPVPFGAEISIGDIYQNNMFYDENKNPRFSAEAKHIINFINNLILGITGNIENNKNNNDIMQAIGKVIAKYTQDMVINNSNLNNNTIIELTPLLKPWKQGNYNIGDIVCYNNLPYKCIQAHDSTDVLNWDPSTANSLWANYHALDKEHALPYVQPSGNHDSYMKDEWCIYDGDEYYIALQDNLVWDPKTYPQGWKMIE